MTLVMKFGGTSIGSPEAIRRTADLVQHSRESWPRIVVVASAMSGVTDLLLKGARTAGEGDAAAYLVVADTLRRQHKEAVAELLPVGPETLELTGALDRIIDRFEALCQAVQILGELTPRALDTICAMGEQMSVRVLAAYLRHQGLPGEAVDATEVVVTDANFQSATPLMDQTGRQARDRLEILLADGRVPVVTGFIGATEEGVTTTLGRGGSDFSAAILGQALDATEVWIWTDVDGVMTADPRLVPNAKTVSQLTYREVAELAFYGAKVLHPKTIRPCVDHGIPLRIKNTFNPDHPGTEIVGDTAEPVGLLKAVTAIRKLALVTVEGRGMMGVPGIAARTFGAVARSRDSVLLITQASSEQSICFAIPDEASQRVIVALEEEFAVELARHDIDRIWDQRPVAIVTVVGAGMRGTPGIAGRIFSALGQQRVNVIAIAQGSSECSVSMVVEEQDTGAAETALHRLILMDNGH
jgi:bifunctional aspartokinase / homoserine dehydrogenase 1